MYICIYVYVYTYLCIDYIYTYSYLYVGYCNPLVQWDHNRCSAIKVLNSHADRPARAPCESPRTEVETSAESEKNWTGAQCHSGECQT